MIRERDKSRYKLHCRYQVRESRLLELNQLYGRDLHSNNPPTLDHCKISSLYVASCHLGGEPNQ